MEIIIERYGAENPPPQAEYVRPPDCALCEDHGWLPVSQHAIIEPWPKLWREAHKLAGDHECDGWHLVKCPDCKKV